MRKQFLSTLINLISNKAPRGKYRKFRFGIFLDQLGIKSIRNFDTGFSVIELILAATLFVIFSSGAISIVLQALSSNRLGGEQAVATQFASEGLEAARSVRNQNYKYLVSSSGTGVRRSAGNVWEFYGTENYFGSNNKYKRVIKVEDVYRSGGNIVTSGGALDKNTKKITSTVTWNFSAARQNSVVLINYLTSFKKPIITEGGLLMYGDGTDVVKHRIFETALNTKFSKQVSMPTPIPTGTQTRTFLVRTSPTGSEAVAGYVDSSGILYIMCFDGYEWTQDWSAVVGGTGETGRFDIAYETNSGKIVVLYSTNNKPTNELAYRTKSGSVGCGGANWSVQVNYNPTQPKGIIQWVKMAWDRRIGSNLITAIYADDGSGLSNAVWDPTGNSWVQGSTLENSLENISTVQDVDNFDVEYMSQSGNVMVMWGYATGHGRNASNGTKYTICTNNGGAATYTGCSWGSIITLTTNDAVNLDISANPSAASNEIILGSVGSNTPGLQLAYWNGTVWNSPAIADTTTAAPSAGTKLVSTGWLVFTTYNKHVIAYHDSGAGNIGWYAGSGGAFTLQTDWAPSPLFTTSQRWYDIQMNPITQNQFLFFVTDSSNSLYAKRLWFLRIGITDYLFWTNSDTGGITSSLSQTISSPFSFAFWRNLTE
ncbi:MAG: hypothetical protein HYT08_04755 [Candidatus Levybacteria bacterium]|nr:hypothetical protein [Candidatus Levybacteria bacterium]